MSQVSDLSCGTVSNTNEQEMMTFSVTLFHHMTCIVTVDVNNALRCGTSPAATSYTILYIRPIYSRMRIQLIQLSGKHSGYMLNRGVYRSTIILTSLEGLRMQCYYPVALRHFGFVLVGCENVGTVIKISAYKSARSMYASTQSYALCSDVHALAKETLCLHLQKHGSI
jgi:hypothetical protein